MPLVLLNLSKGWQIPDDSGWERSTASPQQWAALVMRTNLTSLVASAVNCAERRRLPRLRSREMLTGGQVLVNLGVLHAWAENAEEAQILVHPGGGPRFWFFRERRQKRRRRVVHDYVRDGLARLEDKYASGKYPVYDIEVLANGRMTGSTTRHNVTLAFWGGATPLPQP
jgi:hypothetical protein